MVIQMLQAVVLVYGWKRDGTWAHRPSRLFFAQIELELV